MIKNIKIIFNIYIGHFLKSDFIGYLIRKFYADKIPFKGKYIFTNSPIISNSTVASIFFQMYESAEIRFIEKYLNQDKPVIELGASLGIVSMTIARLIPNCQVNSIEANPLLLPIIRENLKQNCIVNVYPLNKALSYSEESIFFSNGHDNLTGTIVSDKSILNSVELDKVTLRTLLNKLNLYDSFILVSDIEGAEIEYLLNDAEALNNCSQLFIELHEIVYKDKIYSVSDLEKIVLSIGFKLVDRYGNVFYFNK